MTTRDPDSVSDVKRTERIEVFVIRICGSRDEAGRGGAHGVATDFDGAEGWVEDSDSTVGVGARACNMGSRMESY